MIINSLSLWSCRGQNIIAVCYGAQHCRLRDQISTGCFEGLFLVVWHGQGLWLRAGSEARGFSWGRWEALGPRSRSPRSSSGRVCLTGLTYWSRSPHILLSHLGNAFLPIQNNATYLIFHVLIAICWSLLFLPWGFPWFCFIKDKTTFLCFKGILWPVSSLLVSLLRFEKLSLPNLKADTYNVNPSLRRTFYLH